MLAGINPLMMGGGGPPAVPYATAVAAITNKSFWCRADNSAAANGDSINTTPLANEGSLGFVINSSSGVWETNSQNSLRGLKLVASQHLNFSPGKSSDLFLTSGRAFTVFLVEKRTGLQGASNQHYLNSFVMGSDYFSLAFAQNSRQMQIFTRDSGPTYNDVGAPFSDGVAYAMGVRSNSAGDLRVNRNGTITTAAGVVTTPAAGAEWYMGRSPAGVNGPNYHYELIFTMDVISDANMDNMVQALKTKWGIA